MNLKEMLGMRELKNAAKTLKEKPQKLFFIVMYDLLFLLLYGFIVQSMLNKMLEYVMGLAAYASNRSGTITRSYLEDTSIFTVLKSEPEMAGLFYGFLTMVALAVTSLYIIYILFEGLSWRESQPGRMAVHDYLKKFGIASIPWYALFIILQILSFITSYLGMVAERAGSYFPTAGYLNAINAAMLAVVYFAIASYGLIGQERAARTILHSIKLGLAKVFVIMPKYLTIALMFTAIERIMAAAQSTPRLMVALGIVLVMPAIALTKVYSGIVTNEVRAVAHRKSG